MRGHRILSVLKHCDGDCIKRVLTSAVQSTQCRHAGEVEREQKIKWLRNKMFEHDSPKQQLDKSDGKTVDPMEMQ